MEIILFKYLPWNPMKNIFKRTFGFFFTSFLMLTLFLSLAGFWAGLAGAGAGAGAAVAALILAVSSCQAASGAFLSICKLCTALTQIPSPDSQKGGGSLNKVSPPEIETLVFKNLRRSVLRTFVNKTTHCEGFVDKGPNFRLRVHV